MPGLTLRTRTVGHSKTALHFLRRSSSGAFCLTLVCPRSPLWSLGCRLGVEVPWFFTKRRTMDYSRKVALCLVITRRRSRIGEKSVIWSFARPSRGSNPHFRLFPTSRDFGLGVGLLAASDFAPRSPIFLEPSSRHGRCAIFVQHLTCRSTHRVPPLVERLSLLLSLFGRAYGYIVQVHREKSLPVVGRQSLAISNDD